LGGVVAGKKREESGIHCVLQQKFSNEKNKKDKKRKVQAGLNEKGGGRITQFFRREGRTDERVGEKGGAGWSS